VIALADGGGALEARAQALPFSGRRSLRRRLRNDPYLAPFIDLPRNENGLEVGGLAASGKRVLLGLRGPLLDNRAVVVELTRHDGTMFFAVEPTLHFLDLGGIGVRDLARHGSSIFVLGGPVSSADGPFTLFQWRPRGSARSEKPVAVFHWPTNGEHPTGLCVLERGRREGLLVLYDGSDKRRIDAARYRADWIPLSALRPRSASGTGA
jgi:hypothetical protein